MDAKHHLEQGDIQRPLLVDDEGSGSIQHSGMPLKAQEQQINKSYCCKAPTIILGLQYLEVTAFYGVYMNLVVYLHDVLHGNNASNAANVSTWVGASYLMPMFGAVLADSYWGKYKTTLVSLCIYLIGLVIITISATLPSLRPPPCEQSTCISATLVQNLVFFSGMYLCAFGCGGIKSTLLSFGAEQYDDNNALEREKASYFSWYYAIANLGMLTAGTLLVWIEDKISWGLGYGICALCIAFAAVCFAVGTPTYRILMPEGSPLKGIFQVLTAFSCKVSLEVPTDSSILYEEDVETSVHLPHKRLEHTNQFRWLDKAAIITDSDLEDGNPWKLCTLTQVEELKILLSLIPIWVTCAVYFAANCQVQTTFVQQGSKMNTRIISSFSIPAASLASFEMVTVTACIFLYNKVVVPTAQRCFNKTEAFTQLQRMGFAHFMVTLAMAMAAYTEACRLERAKAGQSMNIRWLLPQYFIMAISDAFLSTGQLEFFYDQSPETMRSISTAFYFLSFSLGNLLNSQMITLVAFVTTAGGSPGWIPPDLDDGHLDYYFLVLAGITIANFVAYLMLARNYTLKRVRRYPIPNYVSLSSC